MNQFVEAVRPYVRPLVIAWHTIAGVLASAELIGGQLSILLGPETGPKVAAVMMLTNIVIVALEAAFARSKPQEGK